MVMSEIWIMIWITAGLLGLVFWNTLGIQITIYGTNSLKTKNKLRNWWYKEENEPTLAQSVDARSKMMRRKKDIYAMSAEEKNFRNYLMNGNRSCVTWNGNLLDGASLPLKVDANYLKAKSVILIPKTPIDG